VLSPATLAALADVQATLRRQGELIAEAFQPLRDAQRHMAAALAPLTGYQIGDPPPPPREYPAELPDNATVTVTSRSVRSTAPPRPVQRRGRPKLYTEANEPRFVEDLKRVAHDAVRAGEHLTPTSLARYGLADRRTIGPALELYGYDLDKIEAEAIRCTQGSASFCTFHVRDAARFKKKRP
jgi:hypothetical protein